jgi:hypothetical protein
VAGGADDAVGDDDDGAGADGDPGVDPEEEGDDGDEKTPPPRPSMEPRTAATAATRRSRPSG